MIAWTVSLTRCMSHRGVLVAPQMPIRSLPLSHEGSISASLLIRWESGLACWHSANRMRPLLLLAPLTNRISS